MTRPSFTAQQIGLLVAPPLLLVTAYAVFSGLAAWLGPARGYLGGFLFYWIGWCLLVPLWAVGKDGLRGMFRRPRPPLGRPAWLGLFMLTGPVVVTYVAIFPAEIQGSDTTIVLLSALFALVNGTLEEVLWRGTYITAFPGSWLWGVVYPSIGFGFWHLAPQAVFPSEWAGGVIVFALMPILLGLMWGWVAKETTSIRWIVVAHILLDFAGLGGGSFL